MRLVRVYPSNGLAEFGTHTVSWGGMDSELTSSTATSTRRSSAQDRLGNPEAVLTRSDLAELGYERRAIDAIFRACPVESWPGYSRPMIRVGDFLDWRARCTYDGSRVRPSPSALGAAGSA